MKKNFKKNLIQKKRPKTEIFFQKTFFFRNFFDSDYLDQIEKIKEIFEQKFVDFPKTDFIWKPNEIQSNQSKH